MSNYLDKCPNTPQNALVDKNGCIERQIANSGEKITYQNKHHQSQNEFSLVEGYDVLNEIHLADMIFTDGKLHCFQVSSFRDKNVADKETNNLIFAGHNAFVVEAYPFNNYQLWHRVRIGYFKSFGEAKAYKEKYFE